MVTLLVRLAKLHKERVLKNDIHDLGLVLDSKVKLVVIESWDEMRVLETLTGASPRSPTRCAGRDRA